MKKILNNIWEVIEPIVELSIYLAIAKAISEIFNISFMYSMTIVFTYFVLNIARIIATVLRNKYSN